MSSAELAGPQAIPETRPARPPHATLELLTWSERISAQAVLFGVPALFAIIGLALRYAAYASQVPDATLAAFPDALCRWDCPWYVELAQTGYEPFPVPKMTAGGNWAFFPLLPIMVWIAHTVVPLPTIVVGTAVSIALSYATAIVSRPLFENPRAHVLFSAYLLCGPFSIYFTTLYTEVLFVFLTVCTLVALKRSDYLAAGGAAALLSATRIVGVFIGLAILVRGYVDHRRQGGTVSGFLPQLFRRPDLLLALAITPLGLCAYMAFLNYWIGDGLAFAHVQRAWARVTGNPLVFVWNALTEMPSEGWFPSWSQQLGVAVICGFVLTGVLFVRRRFGWAIFSFACLLMPLFAGMASTLRFTAALAPVLIAGVELLAARTWLFALSLAGFLAADFFVTQAWMQGALSLV